jgi:hypothetical protein
MGDIKSLGGSYAPLGQAFDVSPEGIWRHHRPTNMRDNNLIANRCPILLREERIKSLYEPTSVIKLCTIKPGNS